jgi:hypothetical protein
MNKKFSCILVGTSSLSPDLNNLEKVISEAIGEIDKAFDPELIAYTNDQGEGWAKALFPKSEKKECALDRELRPAELRKLGKEINSLETRKPILVFVPKTSIAFLRNQIGKIYGTKGRKTAYGNTSRPDGYFYHYVDLPIEKLTSLPKTETAEMVN